MQEILWGQKSRTAYLWMAAAVVLFGFLGTHDIWTQEHRWADIVMGMFYRNDFLHPYLNDVNYYDKPLLSYWLIAGFSYLTGLYSTWALRLPSALAGLLAIYSIYRLGTNLKDKQLGMLSGWMLLTTFYFIFWARTSSADMLNMAGSLFAVSWYFEKKQQPSFLNYSIFFLIIALTSLCKGLIGVVIPFLAVLPDLISKNEWKKHLRLSFFLSMIPALIIYMLPFWASAHFDNGSAYQENGLYLVYRENILRYFQPFDHKGPIYTYLIFLPVYLLPWTLFFIPALFSLKSRWKNMSDSSKWMLWSVVILFLFMTLSGSRRNYYVLPLVPFAILLTADWILQQQKYIKVAGNFTLGALALMVLVFNVLQPMYYANGLTVFSENVKQQSSPNLNYVMLDPESKVRFYLALPPDVKNFEIHGKRSEQTLESLMQAWPMLKENNNNVVWITRKMYEPLLKNIFKNYTIVETPPNLAERLFGIHDVNAPVAFIPQR
jgi:4-amino-4-deoxy-L-arabinose transferase-like glycosyltransferase